MKKNNKNKDINLDDYQEIVSITFDNENPHLAITHKAQGYSANGWHQSLLTKNAESGLVVNKDIIKAVMEVEVKLTFEEFLKKFMYMYSDDAELLTKILGFQTDYEKYCEDNNIDPSEYYTEYLDNKTANITLLKSSDLAELSQDQLLSVVSLQKSFEEGIEQFDITFEEDTKNEVKESEIVKQSSVKKETTENNTEVEVDIKEFMKSSEGQALIAQEINKAKEKFDADLETKTQELLKATEELNAFREEKKTRIKESYTNLVKSLSFISDEDKESVVETLMKAGSTKDLNVMTIISQLEKAQAELEKAKENFVTEEDGVEVIEEQVDLQKSVFSDVDAQIEATFGNKQFQ